MKFAQVLLIGIWITTPCWAELSHLDLKGVDALLKPEYVSRFSVANGFKVLKTDSLSNIRFFGNFGAENKSYPCHAQITERTTDCPQGPVETVIQHLFPSPDGVNLIANQSSVQDPFHVQNLSNETLGKLLGAIAHLSPEELRMLSLEENKARKDELISDLTGILFGFNKNAEKINLRIKLEDLQVQRKGAFLDSDIGFLDVQIKKITPQLRRIENTFKKTVQGERANQIKIISKIWVDALIEENQERPSYPEYIVEQTLLAYFSKKAVSREDILDLYQGASHLIQQKYINLVTQKDDLGRAEWIANRYKKEDYFNWKNEFKNDRPTQDQIDQLATSPEHAAFYSYSYSFYEAGIPPLSDFSSAAHESLVDALTKRTTGPRKGQGTYPNCGEQTINNFIDIGTYNKEGSKFDFEYLKIIERDHKLDLSRLIDFYKEYPSPEDVYLESRKDRFSDLVSNQNSTGIHKIHYLKPSQKPVCEINAGITNTFSVLEVLLGDHGPQGLIHLKTNQEKFDRLCKLFSREDFYLGWRLKGSKDKEIGGSDFADVEFTVNGTPQFEWSFQSGHFSIKPVESETSNWRFQIASEAAKRIRENKGDLSSVNWFMGPQNSNEVLDQLTDSKLDSKSPKHAFPQVIYGPSLRLESAKYSAIRQIATHKREDLYPQLEKWAKSLPLDDLYTQSSLYNLLVPLKEVEGLPEGLTDLMRKIKDALCKEPQKTLFFAAENGHKDIVRMLTEAKTPLDTKNNIEWTPLHVAASRSYTETVKALLEAKAPVDAKDTLGSTPLHVAASEGYTETVKALLEAKAPINAKDTSGSTPLHSAASRGYTETVKALLEAKALVDAKDGGGSTPLHEAASKTPLHEAASKGYTETVKALVEAKAPIDGKDSQGYTPLLWAAYRGSAETVKALLGAKALIDVKNKQGYTPLHGAAMSGSTETVKVLLEAKALIDAKGSAGSTPLHLAVITDRLEVVKLLAEHSTLGQIQEELEKNPSQNIQRILKEILSSKEK